MVEPRLPLRPQELCTGGLGVVLSRRCCTSERPRAPSDPQLLVRVLVVGRVIPLCLLSRLSFTR
jgi:hypothetical protein